MEVQLVGVYDSVRDFTHMGGYSRVKIASKACFICEKLLQFFLKKNRIKKTLNSRGKLSVKIPQK